MSIKQTFLPVKCILLWRFSIVNILSYLSSSSASLNHKNLSLQIAGIRRLNKVTISFKFLWSKKSDELAAKIVFELLFLPVHRFFWAAWEHQLQLQQMLELFDQWKTDTTSLCVRKLVYNWRKNYCSNRWKSSSVENVPQLEELAEKNN